MFLLECPMKLPLHLLSRIKADFLEAASASISASKGLPSDVMDASLPLSNGHYLFSKAFSGPRTLKFPKFKPGTMLIYGPEISPAGAPPVLSDWL